MARRKQSDAGEAEVEQALHDAQERGYLGQRPPDAPSFASQTVAGVLAGDNIEEAPAVELGQQAGETDER